MRDPMLSHVLGFLSTLVGIPSIYPPGDTRCICAFLAQTLSGWGYATRILSRDPAVANVIATLGQGRPSLAFNCHIDTVGVTDEAAWDGDPFKTEVRQGRIYGLGANNCKGPAAAQLWAAQQIAACGGPARGQVAFTFVGDEEALGPNGTAFLREEGYIAPDMLVVGAQTENALITRERGVTWIEVVTHGRAAHAGRPTLGDNAIMRMARLLCHLERSLFPAIDGRSADGLHATISPGSIVGGANINVVPASCHVVIDRRLLPVRESIDTALNEIRGVLADAGEPSGSFEVRRLTGTNGFAAPQECPLVSAFTESVRIVTGRQARFADSVGAFDGRFFADDGIQIVDFGPGEGSEGHKANESLPMDQLVDAARIQFRLVEGLLGLVHTSSHHEGQREHPERAGE
jgi:acetylornithine deacetylase/succinyl-diaminopimelate desuccinylase family protein